MIEVIRYAQPDFIITHSPTDYMPDHLAVQKLVFDAAFAASVPHYAPGAHPDITDTIDLKIEMLECHESQLKWMRDHDHIDFADFVRTCSKFRGYQSNCAYAEGFTEELVYPKVVTKRLLP